MRYLARLTMIAALAVFLAGSVLHAAGSAAMATETVAADMVAMADCGACGGEDAGAAGIACDFVCNVSGFAAMPAPAEGAGPVAASRARPAFANRSFRGLTGLPAKEPPRISI